MNTKRFSVFFLATLTALGVTKGHAQPQAHGITDGTQLNHHLLAAVRAPSSPFLLNDEVLETLSKHVQWRRLLMFHDVPQSAKKEKSRIHDASFFLSKTGQTSPKDELIAMLAAIEQGDEQVLCQFPARTQFLVKELAKLGVQTAVSDGVCQDFHAWADKIGAQSLSLVFAEEHGNNISSAFAHAFMRMDARADDAQGQFATAMNYTVAINPKDSAIGSAIKPIIGRYAGVMEILPYREKANDYLVKDERDLWEYRLDLSPDEVMQIMRHLWEVRNLQRPYYLTHDNCATEIARLVDVVRPDADLTRMLGAVTTPAKIAQIFDAAKLIDKVNYHPSNSTKRQAVINNGENFDISAISPNNNNPVNASPTHRLSVALNDERRYDEPSHHISFRTAYQDLLDNPAGVRKFHELILPSLDVAYQNHQLKLHELTIIKTTSFNPSNAAKAYPDGQATKKAPASRAYLGLIQATDASDESNDKHLVLDIYSQKGKSWTLGQPKAQTGDMSDTLCYALAGAGAQVGKLNQGYRIGVRTTLGCVHHWTAEFRMLGELELPYWYHKDSIGRESYIQPMMTLGAQYDFGRQQALRATMSIQKNYHQTDNAWRLELLRYF